MTTAFPEAREVGRRERRRDAIVCAARSLFLERGYDAVTLNEIVRRSGGSLSTLYDLFENKAGILSAILADERFEGLERLDSIVAQGHGAAKTLCAVARSIQQDLMRPHVVGLMRLVMAESLRDDAFARTVYETAHLPRVLWLTNLFAGWAERGAAVIPDPRLAAQFFLGLVLHGVQTRALFGQFNEPTGEGEGCLSEAVRIFLAGYAIDRRDGMACG